MDQAPDPPSSLQRTATTSTFSNATSESDSHMSHNLSTSSNSNIDIPKKKGFLDLPAELRNRIYEFALVADGCQIELDLFWWCKDPKVVLPKHWKVSLTDTVSGRQMGCLTNYLSVNLLRTCRSINVEATPMFYGNNHFTLSSETIPGHPFSKSTLRHVRFLRLAYDWHRPKILNESIGKLQEWAPIMKKMEKLEVVWTSENIWHFARDHEAHSARGLRGLAEELLPVVKEFQKSKNVDDRAAVDMIELFTGVDGYAKRFMKRSATSPTEKFRAELLILLAEESSSTGILEPSNSSTTRIGSAQSVNTADDPYQEAFGTPVRWYAHLPM